MNYTKLNIKVSDEIQKDIMRTFPQLKFFKKNEEGFNKLSRLLHALSSYKNLGYIQGMNFIAATVLV